MLNSTRFISSSWCKLELTAICWNFLSTEHVKAIGLFLLSVSLLEEQVAGICKCAPIIVLSGTLSYHPLLESDDTIFRILKGVQQKVNAETISPHKSLLL